MWTDTGPPKPFHPSTTNGDLTAHTRNVGTKFFFTDHKVHFVDCSHNFGETTVDVDISWSKDPTIYAREAQSKGHKIRNTTSMESPTLRTSSTEQTPTNTVPHKKRHYS